MSNYEVKQGHPVLGIILGILGILAAIFLCLFTGIIGGAIAGILGLAAFLIGLNARKYNKGFGAIFTGALALVLAVVFTIVSINTFKEIRNEASRYAEKAPLVVKCLDNPYLGIIGMIIKLPKDEGSAQELLDQFHLIEDEIKKSNGTTETKTETTTEAPTESKSEN